MQAREVGRVNYSTLIARDSNKRPLYNCSPMIELMTKYGHRIITKVIAGGRMSRLRKLPDTYNGPSDGELNLMSFLLDPVGEPIVFEGGVFDDINSKTSNVDKYNSWFSSLNKNMSVISIESRNISSLLNRDYFPNDDDIEI